MAGLLDPTDADRKGLMAYAAGLPEKRSWLSKAGEYLFNKYGQPVVNALSLPGDVYAGRVDPKSDEGIGRAFDLAGLVTVGAGAIPGGPGELRAGIKAFHGSPHDFDRFSMDKIGTGEGAQAYGHGLYFAENEGVARGYRDDLSRRITVDGKPLVANNRRVGSTGNRELDDLLSAFNGDVDAALADVKAHVATLTPAQAARGGYEETIKALEGLRGKVEAQTAGRMYEVRINADPDQFLDWDKPLSEQSAIWDRLRERGIEVPHGAGGWAGTDAEFKARFGDVLTGTPYESMNRRDILGPLLTGGKESAGFVDLVRQTHPEAADRLQRAIDEMNAPTGEQLWRTMRGDPAETTQALREAGIPGIKYLDAGSRGAGDGTRNYVVFDDKLVEIIRKYGWAPGMAIPAAMALEIEQAQREAEGPKS